MMGNSRSQRNNSYQNAPQLGNHTGGNIPPRPPRVNQSQVYQDNDGGAAFSGAQSDAASTPGGGNYRKVFKPNIPPPRSEPVDQNDSYESLEKINALALGQSLTPSRTQN